WIVNLSTGAEHKVSEAVGGHLDAPSWGGDGAIVYHKTTGGRGAPPGERESSSYQIGRATITGDENVFAFRASWASPTTFYYLSDGKIRKRDVKSASTAPETIEFSATMQVTRAANNYVHRKRDFTSTMPRQVLGVVHPVLSPDGKQIAFAAVGDIYVMPVGGKPVTVPKDAALGTGRAWSPDGSQLAYSADKDSEPLQLWIRDMKSGRGRRV